MPERFGNYTRGDVQAVTLTDRPVWDEYGLDKAEKATYKSGGNQLVMTAYRLKDPTGALAAFEWVRPVEATPLKLSEYSAGYGNNTFVQMGNYLLSFQGNRPTPADLKQILVFIPKYDQSSLPALRTHVPATHLIPNSEKYVLGPRP